MEIIIHDPTFITPESLSPGFTYLSETRCYIVIDRRLYSGELEHGFRYGYFNRRHKYTAEEVLAHELSHALDKVRFRDDNLQVEGRDEDIAVNRTDQLRRILWLPLRHYYENTFDN